MKIKRHIGLAPKVNDLLVKAATGRGIDVSSYAAEAIIAKLERDLGTDEVRRHLA